MPHRLSGAQFYPVNVDVPIILHCGGGRREVVYHGVYVYQLDVDTDNNPDVDADADGDADGDADADADSNR